MTANGFIGKGVSAEILKRAVGQNPTVVIVNYCINHIFLISSIGQQPAQLTDLETGERVRRVGRDHCCQKFAPFFELVAQPLVLGAHRQSRLGEPKGDHDRRYAGDDSASQTKTHRAPFMKHDQTRRRLLIDPSLPQRRAKVR